jgi:3-deoxy-7-phosphoheptulonate synthase
MNQFKLNWRDCPAAQQPVWPDLVRLADSVETLRHLPALVFAGETRSLRNKLKLAEEGKAFILQCGDCAEEFTMCHGPRIHQLLKVILQMSAILSFGGHREIIRIGRIAGQYAKPRSSDTELVEGVLLPSYRGDMVNGFEPTLESRTPDPRRIVDGYFRAAATLNLIRAFTMGGYAAWDFAPNWHDGFRFDTATETKFQSLIQGIRQSFEFMRSLGVNMQDAAFTQAPLYTSHEALLLEYEDALTRIDTTTGQLYNAGAHMVWLGDRTRQLNGAHVAYASTVQNPIGIKIGPNFEPDDVVRVLDRVNAYNEQGKVVLITRFGAKRATECLPPLIRAVKREGHHVAWSCDPMHGNTYVNPQGIKTRDFKDIHTELLAFFAAHIAEGSVPAGVHLEITGESVTECIGGISGVQHESLTHNYQSSCDPRLNASQALEIAFELSQVLAGRVI